MSSTATFSQYAPEDGVSRGFSKVVVSRQGACSDALPTADVTVRIGPVTVRDKQPGFARIDNVVRRKLEPCGVVPDRHPGDRALPRRGHGLTDVHPERDRHVER